MKRFIFLFILLFNLKAMALTQSELHEALETSVNIRVNATSYKEYHENLEKLRGDLSNRITDFNDIFDTCFSLYMTPDDKLFDYYDLFSDERFSTLPCRPDVLQRVENAAINFNTAPSAGLLTATEVALTDQKVPLALPKDYSFAPKTIALTFDDGPHPVLTQKLLAILKTYNVTATFFMVGQNSKQFPNIVKEVAAAGHFVGGHSMTHPDLATMNFDKAVAQIKGSMDAIHAALGDVDPFFRFPYGAGSTRLRAFLKQNDIDEFIWNMDSLDWQKTNPTVLLPYAIKQVQNANHGMILFHDIHPQTIAIMPAFLNYLVKNGYKIVVFESSQNNKK